MEAEINVPPTLNASVFDSPTRFELYGSLEIQQADSLGSGDKQDHLEVFVPKVWLGTEGWHNDVTFTLCRESYLLQDIRMGCPPSPHALQPTAAWGMPPMVNAHTHLELSFSGQRLLHPNETMADWLKGVVAAIRSTDDTTYEQGLRGGIAQLQAAGVGVIADIAHDARPWQAWQQAGGRGVGYLEVFYPADVPPAKALLTKTEESQTADKHDDAIGAWLAQTEARLRAAQQQLTQAASTDSLLMLPLLRLGLSPHSPYNVSKRAWQALVQRFPHVSLHSHWAELSEEEGLLRSFGVPSPEAVEQFVTLHAHLLGRCFLPNIFEQGLTPSTLLKGGIQQWQESSLLSPRLHVAHGIHLSYNDAHQLAEAGVSVVLCPRSNLFLHRQLPSWEALAPLHEANLLCLGTDSLMSSPSLSVWEEAQLLRRTWGLSEETLLRMLTLNGLQAMKLPHTRQGFLQQQPFALTLELITG